MKYSKSNSDYILLPINLQLFAAGDVADDDQSGVVDQDDDINDDNGSDLDNSDIDNDDNNEPTSEDEGDEGSKDSDVADLNKPKQTSEENKMMQKARLKYEEQVKAK